ncbi:type II secretion system F family protein [Streptomyces sp. RPT161]|uniref:type II secretion system F family protein n=1 Tax=Streptomyces sp. RPT161 TaxID=3015993 RepID=UPI0022B903DD|nr:type II secretion system F family protein [Streptomyces sp. RPT161]
MSGNVVHRLGMAGALAVALLCTVVALVSAHGQRTARRRREWLLGIEPVRRERWPGLRLAARRGLREWAPPVATGIGLSVLVGGAAGGVVGLAGAYGIRRWRRRPRPSAGQETPGAGRQLPLAADLLAACLMAGATPADAADAVGRTLDGPLGEAMRRVAAELRLGADPVQCWTRLGTHPGADGLGRWMARAATTGVPPVAAVSRLAAEYRAERTRSANGRARRAGVLATAPLGLCFLPAFLVIGVVPVVIGLAEAMTRAR